MTLKKVFGTLGMAVVAVFMTLLVSNPAMAYDNYFSTNDGDPGGRLWWTANGDVVKVCDIEADGWGVRAYVGEIYDQIYYPDYDFMVGGNGNCTTHQASQGGAYDLTEGNHVYFHLCLTRTIDGEKYCDDREWANG